MPEFDDHAQSYSKQVEHAISFSRRGHDFFTLAKVEALVSLVSRRVGDPRTARALDVGCGSGLAHRFLAPRFGSLEAADVSPAMLAIAGRENPGVRYHHIEDERLPLGDDEFDVAVATCVLHHVSRGERQGLLKEMGRVVRPGGIVVVFEHNPLNPLTQLVVSRVGFDSDAELLTQRRLRELVRESNLHQIESRYILFVPWQGAFFKAAEKALRAVPLGAQYYVAARPGTVVGA